MASFTWDYLLKVSKWSSHLQELLLERSCHRRKSRHLKNYIYTEVTSSFLFKLLHQLLKFFAVAPYLQHSEICAAALSGKIFFSFPSSKLKSAWRRSEAVSQRCSVKKVLLKISLNLLEVSTQKSFLGF